MIEMERRLVFVGAGAMGSFVGGMLAKENCSITLIDAWPEHVKAIREQGLRLTGTQGDNVVAVEALHIHEVHRLAAVAPAVVFIAMKAYDSEWGAALIKDYLGPDTVVVSLQNGFNEERITKALGGRTVIGCIASTLGAEIIGPGHVHRAYEPGGSQYVVFRAGEVDGSITPRLQGVVDLLNLVDTTIVTDNLFGERWSKLVANAMINPLAAITGLRDRAMSMDPVVRTASIRLAIEGVLVGRGAGYALVPILGIPVSQWVTASEGRGLDQIDRAMTRMAERATTQGRSSTPVDIELGRRTELDFFNGLIISKGRTMGIATPVNEAVLRMVKQIERRELRPAASNMQALRY